MMEIAGKTAFVTGAASGIGLGIATALSQAGVKVMLCDIEDAALVKAVADLKFTNADVDGVKADVSLKAELQAAADATIARYGQVHILDDRFHETTQLHLGLTIHGMWPFRASHMIRTLETLA